MDEKLKEGIDFSIDKLGIAYTYRNEEVDENGKTVLGEEILLNPQTVRVHSLPMAIYNEDMILSVDRQPFVFPNRLKAEGALAVIETLYPEYLNKLQIDTYNEKSILKNIKSSIVL